MDIKLKDNPLLKPEFTLDYIQSTSSKTQYIKTGVKPTITTKIEIEFEFVSIGGHVFGYFGGSYSVIPYALEQYSGNNYRFYGYGWNGGPFLASTGIKYHVVFSSGNTSVYNLTSDTSVVSASNTFSGNYPNTVKEIYLFGANNNGTVTSRSEIKLYSCKIYDNDVPIRDFVPVLHIGTACLYDKINDQYYYEAGNTDFIYDLSSNPFLTTIDTAYIKNCPKINCSFILRNCHNLSKVRLDIGNISGSLQELLSYSTLGGFNDSYEPQTKPRLVGTWTIDNHYYTNAMLEEARAAFDGLTIVEDLNYNWETMIANDLIAIQTIDDTAPNYNPAASIVLQSKSVGITLNNPLIANKGRWFMTKAEANAMAIEKNVSGR